MNIKILDLIGYESNRGLIKIDEEVISGVLLIDEEVDEGSFENGVEYHFFDIAV